MGYQLLVERAGPSAFGCICIWGCLSGKLAPVLTLEPNRKKYDIVRQRQAHLQVHWTEFPCKPIYCQKKITMTKFISKQNHLYINLPQEKKLRRQSFKQTEPLVSQFTAGKKEIQ